MDEQQVPGDDRAARSSGARARALLAVNTFWMLSGFGIQLAIQAVYFFLLARHLGAGEYGAFVGAVALTSIAAPFASLGAGHLVIRDAARDARLLRGALGDALAIVITAGL